MYVYLVSTLHHRVVSIRPITVYIYTSLYVYATTPNWSPASMYCLLDPAFFVLSAIFVLSNS